MGFFDQPESKCTEPLATAAANAIKEGHAQAALLLINECFSDSGTVKARNDWAGGLVDRLDGKEPLSFEVEGNIRGNVDRFRLRKNPEK